MVTTIVLVFLFFLSTVPIQAQEIPDPSPTRFAKSFEAFARQDKDQPFETGGIVFAGSSSIRMLNIPKVFPGIKALNRGFGGAHISDMNHYLEQGILQYEPSTVVFFCGGNDLWSGKSPAQVKTDFDEFTQRLFARLPKVHLIVLGWRPSPSRIKIIDKEFALNALFEATANQEDRITYLEGTWSRYLDEQGQPMSHLYVSDMLHMNDDGYAIWGEIIRPYLKPLFLVGGDTAVFDKQGHVLPGAKAMAEKPSRVTLVSLLEEMIERDHMARLPKTAYRCAQFSSYDRHSTDPGSPTWWANADRSYFERIEDNHGRKEHVLMDVAGPGAIVRFWATWHGPGGGPFSNGTLRVYLEGQAEPVIEGPMADLISGGALVEAPLSEGVSPDTHYERQGHNLYLPIPYACHCKVTYETEAFIDEGARKGEALYYQINYRTYDKGTSVETFSLEALKQAQPVLARVQKVLSKPERPGAKGLYVEVAPDFIAPGQSQTMVLNGPAAIRSMTIKIQAENQSQALRSTVLKIECDGTGTVWAPLGDFFGTGYHIRSYASWYTEVTADGTMSCDWIMPFHTQATVTLLNLGDQPVELAEYRMGVGPWDWDDQSCYFYAAWRQWSELKTQTNTTAKDLGAFDLNWVTVQGQGHYVGDTLTLFNAAASWWGEGDEKIYVDGEAFPSHFGTGTEDYYGYAWCRPELFASSFHAQPSGAGNITSGFTVNSRYRVLDAIPFQKSLQFDMELWHWAKTHMDYAPTTFWYARPGSTFNVQPDPNEASVPVEQSAQYVPKPRKVENALEGETLKVLECTGGTHSIQNSTTFNWSGNQQLWWIDGKPQDHVTVEFEAPSDGFYDIEVGLTKAVDYGVVELVINDQVKHSAFDCYFTSVVVDAVTLKACRLSAGRNQLKVTLVGANKEAIKRYMFGLDYLLLKP